jgi:hypothetical protein
MSPRREKRIYGRTAQDVRREGIGVSDTYTPPEPTTDSDSKFFSFEYIVELEAGDDVEFMFMVGNLDIMLRTLVAGIANPATPSIIVNVVQVR